MATGRLLDRPLPPAVFAPHPRFQRVATYLAPPRPTPTPHRGVGRGRVGRSVLPHCHTLPRLTFQGVAERGRMNVRTFLFSS